MDTEKINDNLKIKLHYCFIDEDSHSMDAEIFNECERQFIKALKSLEKYIEKDIEIKIEPREKGSIHDILTVFVQDPIYLVFIAPYLVCLVQKFFNSKIPNAKHKTDIVNTKLDSLQKIKELIRNGELTEEEFNYIADNDKDLRKFKSNFFKSAKKEKSVIKIEAKTEQTSNKEPIIMIVDRDLFDSFIIPETIEKTTNNEQKKIFIVSPTLIEGKKSPTWRGIIDNEPIEFKITDTDFLQQVYGKQVTFSNGTYIYCELQTTMLTNLETEETKISREVKHINYFGDDENAIKKIWHKRRKKENKNIEMPSLFDNLNE